MHKLLIVVTGYTVSFIILLNMFLLAGSTVFSNWWFSFWMASGDGVRIISFLITVTHVEIVLCEPSTHKRVRSHAFFVAVVQDKLFLYLHFAT